MTHYDTFVGRLREPHFDWADETQSLHSKDIEFLTKSFLDNDAFFTVLRQVKESGVFRQLDWGSWIVPAKKDEILSLMARWEAGSELPVAGDEAHKPRLQRALCKAAVEALPANEAYVLVIEEF